MPPSPDSGGAAPCALQRRCLLHRTAFFASCMRPAGEGESPGADAQPYHTRPRRIRWVLFPYKQNGRSWRRRGRGPVSRLPPYMWRRDTDARTRPRPLKTAVIKPILLDPRIVGARHRGWQGLAPVATWQGSMGASERRYRALHGMRHAHMDRHHPCTSRAFRATTILKYGGGGGTSPAEN